MLISKTSFLISKQGFVISEMLFVISTAYIKMCYSYFLFSVPYIGPVKNLKLVAYISSLYRETVIWRLWDTDERRVLCHG